MACGFETGVSVVAGLVVTCASSAYAESASVRCPFVGRSQAYVSQVGRGIVIR